MSDIIKGNDLMIFKREGSEPSGPFTYKALGAATNHTLSISREVLTTSNKDTGIFGDNESGIVSWSITTENMMIMADYKILFDAMMKGEKFVVAFSIASNANSETGKPEGGWTISEGGYEGEVLITQLDLNAPNGDKATYSATMTGCGPILDRENA